MGHQVKWRCPQDLERGASGGQAPRPLEPLHDTLIGPRNPPRICRCGSAMVIVGEFEEEYEVGGGG